MCNGRSRGEAPRTPGGGENPLLGAAGDLHAPLRAQQRLHLGGDFAAETGAAATGHQTLGGE
jgi:hypothetical protein